MLLIEIVSITDSQNNDIIISFIMLSVAVFVMLSLIVLCVVVLCAFTHRKHSHEISPRGRIYSNLFSS